MDMHDEFMEYLGHLCEVLGHEDRHVGMKDYCRGLMLPIARKRVEPPGGSSGPVACSRQAPVAAPFRGAVRVVGRCHSGARSPVGDPRPGIGGGLLLDRR